MEQKINPIIYVFMLFFLGAPLGSIVKKGGLGWPVITAILIFLYTLF